MGRDRRRIKIEYTPEFKRRLRALSKKYRHIQSDIQPVIERLQAGEVIGKQIRGIGYTVFKARIRNRDIQKGKRSGYRLIYYLKSPTSIILATIYSKLEKPDISAKEIRSIISEHE